MDTNTCDKCGAEEISEELVWISADDFRPTAKDRRNGWTILKHKRMIAKAYDALCVKCYNEEIRK